MWLPPSVEQKIKAQSADYAHQLAMSDELKGRLTWWNQEVKRLDPYLEVIKASQQTTVPELKPGYYHVLRHNPGGAPTVTPHETPDGEFKELDSSLFDSLVRGDMWSERSQKERDRMAARASRQAQLAAERERADRRQEIAERLESRSRLSVAVSR